MKTKQNTSIVIGRLLFLQNYQSERLQNIDVRDKKYPDVITFVTIPNKRRG